MTNSKYSLFLDSSVIFAAINSVTGGSAKLFSLDDIELVSSETVLGEVERNVKAKLYSHHVERFFMLVKRLHVLKQMVSGEQIEEAKRMIVDKDAVILAEAKLSGVQLISTLDKKHFLTSKVAEYISPQKIVTPKDFFQEIYPVTDKAIYE